ncbi:type II toxin-antitoxin system RelE/ParE family toxin [Sphingomonas sp. MG17]|uniref:Type II toxin-antitoxin system RelE/ParE family toxin n=1 Tax=Sphingomonas tagetis TaxID=2949092 RepID=A0A9X2HT54_9SPHN|nr:type II toxin-antitoxin system RelE/ParE family toxin [Sphingomonas tagetis]MCP3732170.1 type II toxin-antitoxin system RelE/ParE family toxin [Sphingomonas tagetis]
MRIFKNGWFERFARKERLNNEVLITAVKQADAGLIDADLGGGLIKQRIARPGGGKSGGYRSIIVFRSGDRAVFLFGFAKSARDNISKADLALLKQTASEVLGWQQEDLDALVRSGALVEMDDDEES